MAESTDKICKCCRGYRGEKRPPSTMEQTTLPTAPLDVGDGYDRTTSLEVLVCPDCGWWEPCSAVGQTPEDQDG